VAALVLCWVGFWIYLAGSSSSGAIKSELVITLILLLLCRKPREVLSPE